MDYPIVIIPLPEEDGGGYLGRAVDLQGCMSDGATPEEALQNTRTAIAEWIELSKELGRVIPEPGDAARRALKERGELLRAVKALVENYEVVEGRIGELELEIEGLLERVENMEAWTRFSDLTVLDLEGQKEFPLRHH